MHGGIIYPTLFNVFINVILTWLDITVEDKRLAHNGLVEASGQCLGVLYANYGMV